MQRPLKITDNDAATAYRLTEGAMQILTTQVVNLKDCKIIADERVKEYQIKDILETIEPIYFLYN